MGKRVLITGGTGFLGRRLDAAMQDSHKVFLGARSNTPDLAAAPLSGGTVIPCEITCIESVRAAVIASQPDLVIHAAAFKFVELSADQPLECIKTNVLGSENVARTCMDLGVATVIGISSEKAAPPVRTTYGLTKALMERMFCSLNGKSATKFACVRFGNLAWSPGSVLPIWQKMHDETGVIGTTGPEMRRFFLSADEAVELILLANGNIGSLQGKVLIRRTKSVQIEDMLNLFVLEHGGRWERVAGRIGDGGDEFLVGDSELPFASEHAFGGIIHYVLDFASKNAVPITESLSSATMPRLSDEEIVAIINHPPPAR